jgi:putative membrane protein
MRIFSYLLLLLIVLIGVSFAALNAGPVWINYYIGSSKLPLSLLLVVSLIGGVVLGLVVSFISYIRLQTTNRRLRQRLKLVEEEVANLRALPLKDDH